MIYKSNKKFKFWVYSVSHNSLLIRSLMKFPDEDDYKSDDSFNIDIEFWSVSFINIPTSFNSVKIKEISKDFLPDYIDRELCSSDQKIFEIDDEKKYYIIAGGMMIGSNQWINMDRITNYDLNLKHANIIEVI